MSDEEYGNTVDAINLYELRRREERPGVRGRWAEIRTNLVRGWRGGKDSETDDDIYLTAAERPSRPLHLVQAHEVLDDDE